MSKYALLADEEPVEQLLDSAIESFVRVVLAIRQTYPQAGIGDTATDEAIIQEAYGFLHDGLPEREEEDDE